MSTQPSPPPFLRRTLSRIRKAAEAARDISGHFYQQFSGESARPSRHAKDGNEDLDIALEWCDVAAALPVLLDSLHQTIANRDAQKILDMAVIARLNLENSDFTVPEPSEPSTTVRVWPISSSEPACWEFDFPDLDDTEVHELPISYPPQLFSRVIQRDLWRIHGRTDTVDLVFLPTSP